MVPHDIHDYDATQIPVLADMGVEWRMRKALLFAPKTGYLYVLDRTNGKLPAAHPIVESAKNWATEIRPDGRPALGPDDGTHCLPDIHGGSNYGPPSYDPALGLFFVTVHEVCEIFNPARRGEVGGAPASWTIGGAGFAALRALEPLTGKMKWEYRFPPSDFGLTGVGQARSGGGIGPSGGVLSTASGLLFTGDNEGQLHCVRFAHGHPALALPDGFPGLGFCPDDLHAQWQAARADRSRTDADRLRPRRPAAEPSSGSQVSPRVGFGEQDTAFACMIDFVGRNGT